MGDISINIKQPIMTTTLLSQVMFGQCRGQNQQQHEIKEGFHNIFVLKVAVLFRDVKDL